jgi:hypothetical protein
MDRDFQLFAAGRRRGRAVGQPLIVYSEQQIAFLQQVPSHFLSNLFHFLRNSLMQLFVVATGTARANPTTSVQPSILPRAVRSFLSPVPHSSITQLVATAPCTTDAETPRTRRSAAKIEQTIRAADHGTPYFCFHQHVFDVYFGRCVFFGSVSG